MKVEVPDYKTMSLPDIRDRLLPGLDAINEQFSNDYESDISVDFHRDTIWIKVYRFSTKKLSKYEMKRIELPGGFAPKVTELFEELK